ncbi:OmpW family protein [Halomonas campisalis]|uniref:OmpW family protein n=1 Tax=Billgrantia campisalis TaxID=74661 RepID=A0ABS9PBY6_9GAMM|nr:OmpW family outer membrane protein [Halomonas campisalis]MCG6659266.1 OmpW family protein [Halomonas campisalis]MDR5864265.1 OmpW family outer membrane protein [Halomonas campisalis]
MRANRLIPTAMIAAGCLFASQVALAYSAGDTFVRGGFAKTDTRSDNGVLDTISSGETGFTFGAGYLFHDNVGIELNSSEKIEHTIDGGETIDRMPVNLMVNYYPLGGLDSRVQPYAGAGLNYTRFSGEPTGINARRSYGAVGQLGVDLAVTDHFLLNGFANYADVESRLSVDGDRIGRAKVDPLTIGGGVTFRF